MKNMWKRAASLMLCGVLLMGSVPVQVWATDGGDAGGSAPEKYVKINDNVVSDEELEVIDGVVTLTLDEETEIETIEIKGQSLTINVVGANEINAGADVAITTDSDLTISGEGSLKVTTTNATAIYVAGSVGDEDNKKGLTIGGVQLDVRTTYEKPQNPEPESTLPDAPIGIDSVNGVVIEGAAHFKTSHSKSGTEYALVRGYCRNSEGNPFRDAGSAWDADGSAFEFVADEHLEWVYVDEDEHELNCKKNGVENCILNQTAIASGEHSVGVAAGCGSKIKCGVCEGYYGDPVAEHKGTKTLVPIEGGKHDEKYSECGHFVGNPLEHTFNSVALSEENTVLTVKCECGVEDAEQRVTLEPPQNLIWDNSKKCAVVTPADKTVKYYSVDEAGIETVLGEDKYPVEPGKYAAKVDVKIGEETYVLAVTYTILGASVTDEMVTLSTESVTYDGQVKTLPEVTVGALVKGTDYEVAFTRNGAPVDEAGKTNAGEIVVTVTGKGNYSGTGTKTFKILQAEATASEFKYTAPANLTYNGQPKVATIETNNTVMGMGDTEVKYYKNGTLTEQCIDAGIYEARVYVKGTGNYAEKEIQNNWIFEITAANVGDEGVCTVSVEDKQTIGTGVGEFKAPTFTGYTKAGATEADKLTGTITYTYDTDKTTQDIVSYLGSLSDGATAKLDYTFTPTGNNNYTGTKTGKIEVTKVTLTFEYEDGTKATNQNIVKDGKSENTMYGDSNTDIFKIADLTAKANGAAGEKGVGFTVKYAKVTASGPDKEQKDAPVLGPNRYYIYYNGKIGDYTFVDVLVCSGDIRVSAKAIEEKDITAPVDAVVSLGAEGSVALLSDTNKGKIGTDTEGLVYRKGTTGNYSAEVPTVTEAGCYEVFYKPSANYTNPYGGMEKSVKILVLPYLTATYGDKLSDIELPPGFSFNAVAYPNPEEETVGNAGTRKVKLDYEASGYTKTDQEATLKVSPKEVTKDDVTVTLNAALYDQNEDGYVAYSYAAKDDLFIVKIGTKTLTYGTDYTMTKQASLDGLTGKHIVKSKDNGNYQFVSDDENDEIFGEVKLYKTGHAEAKDTDKLLGEILEGTDHQTVKKAKTALSDKLKADAYPADEMKFFKVYFMNQTGAKLADNLWKEYMPADMPDFKGCAYEIPYSDLDKATEKDEFKVAVLYLAGDNAGKIVELKKDEGFTKTDDGIKLKNLEREAIVCVAKSVDLTKEYTITKAIMLDGKTSTQGTLTVKVDDKAATKATYGKTVKVTATAKSGYSVEKVTVIDESTGKAITTSQSGSTYQFKMPGSNVTVKLSLKKTTSSTKNPSSGDTSNIRLWITLLAASVVGIGALAALWFLKRKK